jgi:hypothetical protein
MTKHSTLGKNRTNVVFWKRRSRARAQRGLCRIARPTSASHASAEQIVNRSTCRNLLRCSAWWLSLYDRSTIQLTAESESDSDHSIPS